MATVKAMVMGGFGVGALLDYMITADEERRLVRSRVPHDPECGVFVVGAPMWRGEAAAAIEEAVVEAMREVLGGRRPDR